jgi:signal transduction histidine kinase
MTVQTHASALAAIPAALADDVDIVAEIAAVPGILDIICHTTGMGFAAIARVTEDRWIACSVRDDIDFGLRPGGELKVETTLCHEIRQAGTPIVINEVAADACYAHHHTPALYGFQSYISMPIRLPDGGFFGTLCAIDPRPRRLDTPEITGTFTLFAELLGFHIDAHRRLLASGKLTVLNQTLTRDVAARTAERNLLASIVESTDVLVMVADLDFNILATNGAMVKEFMRVYGISLQIGDNLLALLAAQPVHQAQVRDVWGRALAGEEFALVESIGDADRTTYEMKFRNLFNEDGERIGAYQFVNDISERQRDQARLAETMEALRQAQKMEAVGQLTGGIAHDFNNLLTGITGSLDMIEARVAQGRVHELEKYTIAAKGAARRAAALTHRLLAFSRRQTLDARPTNIVKLVDEMSDLIARTVGPHITVETVHAGGLWTALIDPHQLENALLNLCINARDAMPDGGRLTIETANRWLDERAAAERDLTPGQYLSLCVSDTGAGMTKDVIARAFDPFFTTKPLGLGTGLGLSMIYGFVRQSNGQVRLYSEPGQGTMACLYLPRHYGAADADEAPAQAVCVAQADGEVVLVVDDEPTVRMLVTEILEELGCTAFEAEDGPTALTRLESGTRIDLLITDVGLPGGMNGRQVADAARRLRPALKVLFITGYAENAAIGSGHLEPGMAVMTKPFAMDHLAARIKSILAAD